MPGLGCRMGTLNKALDEDAGWGTGRDAGYEDEDGEC